MVELQVRVRKCVSVMRSFVNIYLEHADICQTHLHCINLRSVSNSIYCVNLRKNLLLVCEMKENFDLRRLQKGQIFFLVEGETDWFQ